MSIVDPALPPATTPGAPVARSSATTYRLIYNQPEDAVGGYGLGWSLVGEPSGRWRWTVALAAHGASVNAGPRVAKAVALRVLAQQGITVETWADAQPTDGPSAGPAVFVALVRPPTTSSSEPGGDGSPGPRSTTRRLVGH